MLFYKLRVRRNFFESFPIRAAHHEHVRLPQRHRRARHNRFRRPLAFPPSLGLAALVSLGTKLINIAHRDDPFDAFHFRVLSSSAKNIQTHLAAVVLRHHLIKRPRRPRPRRKLFPLGFFRG